MPQFRANGAYGMTASFNYMKSFVFKNRYILILLGLFLLQFLLISPRGEFPLNDDWVHIEMIKHWVETGAFRMNPYTGPLLFFPIIYGAALTKIFSFSFSLFRISTLTLTFFLTIGIFLFIHKKSNNPVFAFLAALTIWLNPIVYNLSFTFMTDVPALAFLFAAIFCFVKGQENNNWRYFFLGSLAGILGFYTRQTNILILVAFGLYTLFNSRLRSVKNIVVLGIPAVIGAGIYWWLQVHQLLPDGGASHNIPGKRALLEHAFWWFWYSVLYLGLFTLPITVSLWQTKWHEKKYFLIIGFGLLIPLILYWWRGELFPYVLNMINHFGLGPLSDTLQGNYVPLFKNWVWFLISLACGFGSGLLSVTLWKTWKESENRWLLLFFGLFLLPILFLSSFDRYFLPLFLTVVLILASQFKNIKISWGSWVVLGIIGIYSVTQTQFYLNWNRERAELNNMAVGLVETMPQYTKVDGGYEWTGYLGYWEAQKDGIKRGSTNSPWWIKFLITNNTAEYVVSASPLPNYTTVIEKKVVGWNPNNHLFLLRRNQ